MKVYKDMLYTESRTYEIEIDDAIIEKMIADYGNELSLENLNDDLYTMIHDSLNLNDYEYYDNGVCNYYDNGGDYISEDEFDRLVRKVKLKNLSGVIAD